MPINSRRHQHPATKNIKYYRVVPHLVVYERQPSEWLGLGQAATAGNLWLGVSVMRARDSSPM